MSRRNLTTSILGDAGSAEATVVPNLESLNTGADQYVTSISDTSELNVFGQMKIYDNYWDTFFARHIVNAANAGNINLITRDSIIQSNTEGWVRADHMVLQVPVDFIYTYKWNKGADEEDLNKAYNDADLAGTYTTGAGVNRYQYFDAWLKGVFAWDPSTQFMQNNPSSVYNMETLPMHRHAWFGVIDGFNRIRLLIGNNGQQVQKQIETEPIGMKYHMTHARTGQVMGQVISQWGLANHIGSIKTGIKADLIEAMIPHSVRAGAYVDDPDSVTYFKMLSEIGAGNYDSITPSYRTNRDRWVVCRKTRLLPLPLSAIMPFFRGSKFLPPDFRFKFEIQTNSGATIAMKLAEGQRWIGAINQTGSYGYPTTNAGQAAGGAVEGIPTNIPLLTATALRPNGTGSVSNIGIEINANGIELQYPWHVLRQPVQAAISAMWLQKPFLYNYETIQITEITPTPNSRNIHFAISISTQRPTVLDVMCFPQLQDTYWGQYAVLRRNGIADHRILNSPTVNGAFDAANGANTANFGPIVWTDFEILFSGRTAYRFRNDQYTTKGYGVDSVHANEFFIKLFEEQSWRSTASEYNAYSRVEKQIGGDNNILFNNRKSNSLMRIIIQPGGWTDRGIISSRQGATTITINVAFAKPLSADDRFIVFRSNPEQCVFDSDKNVTLIQWPAIKSNSGYLIPNITAAP